VTSSPDCPAGIVTKLFPPGARATVRPRHVRSRCPRHHDPPGPLRRAQPCPGTRPRPRTQRVRLVALARRTRPARRRVVVAGVSVTRERPEDDEDLWLRVALNGSVDLGRALLLGHGVERLPGPCCAGGGGSDRGGQGREANSIARPRAASHRPIIVAPFGPAERTVSSRAGIRIRPRSVCCGTRRTSTARTSPGLTPSPAPIRAASTPTGTGTERVASSPLLGNDPSARDLLNLLRLADDLADINVAK
jgi:hypothetical protein